MGLRFRRGRRDEVPQLSRMPSLTMAVRMGSASSSVYVGKPDAELAIRGSSSARIAASIEGCLIRWNDVIVRAHPVVDSPATMG